MEALFKMCIKLIQIHNFEASDETSNFTIFLVSELIAIILFLFLFLYGNTYFYGLSN